MGKRRCRDGPRQRSSAMVTRILSGNKQRGPRRGRDAWRWCLFQCRSGRARGTWHEPAVGRRCAALRADYRPSRVADRSGPSWPRDSDARARDTCYAGARCLLGRLCLCGGFFACVVARCLSCLIRKLVAFPTIATRSAGSARGSAPIRAVLLRPAWPAAGACLLLLTGHVIETEPSRALPSEQVVASLGRRPLASRPQDPVPRCKHAAGSKRHGGAARGARRCSRAAARATLRPI